MPGHPPRFEAIYRRRTAAEESFDALPGGGAPVADHGGLSGLADDDHTQYHNDARGDARYSLLDHVHGVFKLADETRTSTTALTADAELVATLEAVTTYRVRGVVYLDVGNATMDSNFDLYFTGLTSNVRVSFTRTMAPGDTAEAVAA